MTDWHPNRSAAISRLSGFAPIAGNAYRRSRNYDLGTTDRSNVSVLSPYVRHRLILEDEILRNVLRRHSFSAAEKFIQEVFWRGYFKGWIEQRPEVWRRYNDAVASLVRTLETDQCLERRYNEAIKAKTGITCFDQWVRELREKGYLHNHARMWFASIWIFTLELPWELGADFFYRHLLDGDPASNTCSWRWVAGLHTKGKTYLARAENISKYTCKRFNPAGDLSANAPPREEKPLPGRTNLAFAEHDLDGLRYGLLLTEEDCHPETLPLAHPPSAILALSNATARSPLPLGKSVEQFAKGAMSDTKDRAERHFVLPGTISDNSNWAGVISSWIRENELEAIVTAYLPQGPVRSRVLCAIEENSLSNAPLIECIRAYDKKTWPHAKVGFFGLKKKIPSILSDLTLI